MMVWLLFRLPRRPIRGCSGLFCRCSSYSDLQVSNSYCQLVKICTWLYLETLYCSKDQQNKIMCIISGEYEKVHSTKLFGARTGNEQLTVYSNGIQQNPYSNNQKPVVMILPIPLHQGSSTDIVMAEINENFFKTLDNHMESTKPKMRGGSSYGTALSGGSLPVYKCGNYQYSVVANCAEFLQIDENILPLDPVIKETMKQSYPVQHAFLVCKMINQNARYTPIGYIHPAHPDGTVRLPTVHVHFNQPRRELANDWDHAIYVVAPPHQLSFPSTEGQDLQERKPDYIFGDWTSPQFLMQDLEKSKHPWASLVDWQHLKRYNIEGVYKNVDVYA